VVCIVFSRWFDVSHHHSKIPTKAILLISVSATVGNFAPNESSNSTNDQPFEDATVLGIGGELTIVYTKRHLAFRAFWFHIQNFNVP